MISILSLLWPLAALATDHEPTPGEQTFLKRSIFEIEGDYERAVENIYGERGAILRIAQLYGIVKSRIQKLGLPPKQETLRWIFIATGCVTHPILRNQDPLAREISDILDDIRGLSDYLTDYHNYNERNDALSPGTDFVSRWMIPVDERGCWLAKWSCEKNNYKCVLLLKAPGVPFGVERKDMLNIKNVELEKQKSGNYLVTADIFGTLHRLRLLKSDEDSLYHKDLGKPAKFWFYIYKENRLFKMPLWGHPAHIDQIDGTSATSIDLKHVSRVYSLSTISKHAEIESFSICFEVPCLTMQRDDPIYDLHNLADTYLHISAFPVSSNNNTSPFPNRQGTISRQHQREYYNSTSFSESSRPYQTTQIPGIPGEWLLFVTSSDQFPPSDLMMMGRER
jgi:hypothetical protein